jgi:predicted Fe-Mo cluster-binding NifX family protein
MWFSLTAGLQFVHISFPRGRRKRIGAAPAIAGSPLVCLLDGLASLVLPVGWTGKPISMGLARMAEFQFVFPVGIRSPASGGESVRLPRRGCVAAATRPGSKNTAVEESGLTWVIMGACSFPMTLNKELVQGREAMKIAIPMAEGDFCEHFGGAKEFWLFEGDRGTRSFHRNERFPAPEHKPGSLPNWLVQQKVDALVASAIGERALVMLATAGIRVFLGDRGMSPAELAMACLAGKLPPANRENSRCNGEHHHHDHEGHDCHH